MVCKDTLKIKNLPKELSEAQKEDFARHFGASKVKVVTSRVKEKSVVYAKFDSEELAKNVLFRLHQICVLNCRLSVEYAEHDILQGKTKLKKIDEPEVSGKKSYKTFINKLNAFNDSLGFDQPPPSHLKYLYPKPNRATINNIAHALATIPRFYTQVLHLMNKMNLPPPFAVEQPPVRIITPAQPAPVIQKPVERTVPPPETTQVPLQPPPNQQIPLQSQEVKAKPAESSSESELESDDGDYFRNREFVPVKRKSKSTKPAVKRPKFIKPPTAQQSSTSTKPAEKRENVFEKVDVQVQKKIEVKVASDTLEHPKQPTIPEQVGSIGILQPTQKPEDQKPPESQQTEDRLTEPEEKSYITAEELAANQIPNKDLGVLPVFKNYHPGAPTCRLYIKNIAKTVVVKDLEYIFNRYKVPEKEEAPSQFDIRLMQEVFNAISMYCCPSTKFAEICSPTFLQCICPIFTISYS
ncbi:unnamed protein product [Acanthoscelides obtectus]|uniref:RRM domain-containing protein n=1 Tax=Acanthoscelides obtectus TaxID=200917 RepID=A0A9P0PPX3_ACAOB|nr:unnamed protein product [Acanthoscelides obtectus]CAK1669556.1 U11/U12 small nuclear ribonucleoprotein 65 kDa protein [Acanthoscelides obtectus]